MVCHAKTCHFGIVAISELSIQVTQLQVTLEGPRVTAV